MIVSNSLEDRKKGHGFTLNTPYEIDRADDPMIVLEEEMEEQPKYEYQPVDNGSGATVPICRGCGAKPNPFAPAWPEATNCWNCYTHSGSGCLSIDLTPDQQIRMKALECACLWTDEAGDPKSFFWHVVDEFEDYLKKGRE